MKKSKTLPLLILLTVLTMLPTYTQTPDGSQKKQNNDYGIEANKSYSGSLVLALIAELTKEAEAEIEAAVNEGYAEGYKQGLLAAKPETAYWKSRYEFLKADTDFQIRKLKNERWLFALGGAGIGFLGGTALGFGFQLQL